MAGAAVLAGVGMMVVVVMFAIAFDVAASSGAEVTESVSSNELGEALSHFTQKCNTRVDQEVMAAGVFISRFSYQFLASKSDLQQL
jgi:hypothetical protein